jgi:hypothetical protein
MNDELKSFCLYFLIHHSYFIVCFSVPISYTHLK